MDISMRDLLGRQGIINEIISVRNSLENQRALGIGLREANRRFTTMIDSNGFARGCPHEGATPKLGRLDLVVPEWVPVDLDETRVAEGILTESKIARQDFPLKPWHTYYDWNFLVGLDKQYTYLLSPVNKGSLECEWDTGFFPSWAWPQDGDRIWIVGRWIYDCGEVKDEGHKTEIHPPKAVVSFRSEATQFSENGGPTQANHAILYIGRDGGYWRQPINDQDYAFDLYLPPKPYAEATPIWKVQPMPDPLIVAPLITPYPPEAPRALRIVVRLKGVSPHPEEYGAIISAGWRDPRGTESNSIQRLRVTINKIFMDANLDPGTSDEWYVYIGINGRWNVWKDLSGHEKNLDISVDLDLHPSDSIHITACGFEADLLHDHMGEDTDPPLTWEKISNADDSTRDDITDLIVESLATTLNNENDEISYFSRFHEPTDRGTFTEHPSGGKDYRLRYTIDQR